MSASQDIIINGFSLTTWLTESVSSLLGCYFVFSDWSVRGYDLCSVLTKLTVKFEHI